MGRSLQGGFPRDASGCMNESVYEREAPGKMLLQKGVNRQATSNLLPDFFFDQPQNDTLFVSVGTNLAIQFSMLAHLLAMPRSKQETGGMMLIRHDKKYGRKIIGRLLPGRKHLDPFKKTMWLPLFFVFPPSFTKRIFFFPPPPKRFSVKLWQCSTSRVGVEPVLT